MINLYKIVGNTTKGKMSCGHARQAKSEYYIERNNNYLFSKCSDCLQSGYTVDKTLRIPDDLVDSDFGKVLPIR